MANLTSENYLHNTGLATITWHAEPNHEMGKGWRIVIDSVLLAGTTILPNAFRWDGIALLQEEVRLFDPDCDDDHFDRLALRYWQQFHEDEADDARRKETTNPKGKQ